MRNQPEGGMAEETITVLLVEDEADHRLLFRKMLAAAGGREKVVAVESLKRALDYLAHERADIVLLDLRLSDSQGMETFASLHAQHPGVPIIVLSGMSDEQMAVDAVRQGAQDYLVKGQFEAGLLSRAIRYGIERHRMREELRSLSLVDELTGLYNRRGFLVLAEQQQKIGRRTRRGFLLFFLDMDGLKHINDTFGHKEGDRAIVKASEVLKEAFRGSDIIARLGGDEFAVLAVEADTGAAQRPLMELEHELGELKARKELPYPLSLSIGVARSNPNNDESIEELLQQADAFMYEEKRKKNRHRS
jgi:diguanylate cyclase (GGDEF)-like protein